MEVNLVDNHLDVRSEVVLQILLDEVVNGFQDFNSVVFF